MAAVTLSDTESQVSRVTNEPDNLFAPPPRTVRPRTRTYRRLPTAAIDGGMVLFESGELITWGELVERLPTLPPTLFASHCSSADLVAELDAGFAERYSDTWNWRATTHERNIVRHDGTKLAARISTVIHYFGWRGGNYHKIVDPVVMYGHKLDRIWPDESPTITRLLHWNTTLRDFCHKNRMEVRCTIGAISGQFLTDRRFYPRKRRKVPMTINERAREALPGNHYVLTVAPSPDQEYTAHYLDQSRAHHYHAQHTPLPHSDRLFAFGRFLTLSDHAFPDVFPDFYGLYCLTLIPSNRPDRSQWLQRFDKQFVYSNELAHFYDMGFTVEGVYAAWGSFKRDTGLARYARWSQKQLDHYGDKPWLKPILLAAYGTLATRPKERESIFRLAKGDDKVTMLTSKYELTGTRVRATRKLEPGIANVLHRGMIESATRSESVGLAQHLTGLGHRVLSIYADAVVVEHNEDKPLPALIEPWRKKETLNHLQFINQQAFISGEMTKLPGVGQELRKYRQHRKPGIAPRVRTIEALTGTVIQTNRRI